MDLKSHSLLFPKNVQLGKHVYEVSLFNDELNKEDGKFEIEAEVKMTDEGRGEYDHGGTKYFDSKMTPTMIDFEIISNSTPVTTEELYELMEKLAPKVDEWIQSSFVESVQSLKKKYNTEATDYTSRLEQIRKMING